LLKAFINYAVNNFKLEQKWLAAQITMWPSFRPFFFPFAVGGHS